MTVSRAAAWADGQTIPHRHRLAAHRRRPVVAERHRRYVCPRPPLVTLPRTRDFSRQYETRPVHAPRTNFREKKEAEL